MFKYVNIYRIQKRACSSFVQTKNKLHFHIEELDLRFQLPDYFSYRFTPVSVKPIINSILHLYRNLRIKEICSTYFYGRSAS